MSFLWLVLLCGTVICQNVGNPDDSVEKIERPCPSYDLNCIRKFFSEHAHCRKTFGPAPDPLFRPQLSYHFPRVNMTVTILRIRAEGINSGRIEEFYVNKQTGNLVLAIEFQNLNLSNNQTYFEFHRRATESVVTTAATAVMYQSVVITASIPNIDDLQLEKAECTAFANDAEPVIIVGPSATESTDPQVQVALAEFLANLPVNSQELFLTDSFYYINAFIQYNICDFGLLVV